MNFRIIISLRSIVYILLSIPKKISFVYSIE